MHKDKDIFLLIADVGLGLVDPIKKDFPDRFLNVGIAEQNMMGIAAGLCNTGYKPFCYSLSNFLIHRCFEQIRNDICLHKYPVTLVGTSTGFDNGILGPTHHVIDDIGCLKALPEIRIYSPGSVQAIDSVFRDVCGASYPAYVRIGKGNYSENGNAISLNHMVIDRVNASLLMITHGNILENCVKAAAMDSRFSLFCMNMVKPLARGELNRLLNQYDHVLVVEDHFRGSGLFNSLCQYAVEEGFTNVRLHVLAPGDQFEARIGTKDFFSSLYGISPEGIVSRVSEILSRKTKE